MNHLSKIFITALAVIAPSLAVHAEYPVDYTAEMIANAGGGDFAPYYISANRHGVLTQKNGILLHGGVSRPLDTGKRLSYDFGVDIYGGATNITYYNKWNVDAGSWSSQKEHPANFWLQQAYASVKYRGVLLTAGMKQRGSYMLDNCLTSGDLIESGNARPIPQVRLGFVDFQNIPLTNRWLQIQGEVGYGFYCQNSWLDNHFDYYNGVKSVDMLFNYKRLYLRTNPDKPFSATFGAQAACQFGGTSYRYGGGKQIDIYRHSKSLESFWRAFLPFNSGAEGFMEGQHIGTWDVRLRYRLHDRTEIAAYVQALWEDGSSMGKLNGWDGLWGLEYKAPAKGWIDGAVVEYLQTTNQSGPLHWDPVDSPGTTIGAQATGCDDYYNNIFYGGYANLGMAQGNPMLKSPLFYNSVDMIFLDNRVKALHIGIDGTPLDVLKYRILGGYRTSWGSYLYPRQAKAHTFSFMLEATYTPRRLPALHVKGQFGLDHGKLLGNNVGGCVTVTYNGLLNF